MRMHGHAAHDDMRYVPDALVEQWKQRDPIEGQERRVAALGVDISALRDEIDAELDAASARAQQGPMPDPAGVLDGLFCEGEAQPLGDGLAPWSGFASGGNS
jgi:TPP-dependent pyruvate/acetoin dehydrogenase alpha subunit